MENLIFSAYKSDIQIIYDKVTNLMRRKITIMWTKHVFCGKIIWRFQIVNCLQKRYRQIDNRSTARVVYILFSIQYTTLYKRSQQMCMLIAAIDNFIIRNTKFWLFLCLSIVVWTRINESYIDKVIHFSYFKPLRYVKLWVTYYFLLLIFCRLYSLHNSRINCHSI